MAKAGDSGAMRLCIDRLIAPRRERPVSFVLPKIQTPADLVSATNALAAGVASVELTTSEAGKLSALVTNVGKAIELVDFEERLARLEASVNRGSR